MELVLMNHFRRIRRLQKEGVIFSFYNFYNQSTTFEKLRHHFLQARELHLPLARSAIYLFGKENS